MHTGVFQRPMNYIHVINDLIRGKAIKYLSAMATGVTSGATKNSTRLYMNLFILITS